MTQTWNPDTDRRQDIARRIRARFRCQHTGCMALATVATWWRTATMPARAFGYYCDAHAPQQQQEDQQQ